MTPDRAPALILREGGQSWSGVVVYNDCGQRRRFFVFAGMLRLILLACLLVAVLLGPVAAMSATLDEHHDTISAGQADGAAEAPAHCDPGPPCAAFIVPAHMAASQTTEGSGVLVRARDKFLRTFGGPAIDLPPPRPLA